MSSASAETLDALLAPPTPAPSDLDALLAGPTAAPAQPEVIEATDEPKGKARLRSENQALLVNQDRLLRLVKITATVAAVFAIAFFAAVMYARGANARARRWAFEVLHYREKQTVSANAIVLTEYSQQLTSIRNAVKDYQGISEEERAIRLRAIDSTLSESDKLAAGFVKIVKDNDRERGKGATFEYKDPFLKRPIDFDAENGGEISLDKLRDEVRAAAKMDEAMKELRAAMLNPMPLADQMRAEATRQGAPVMDPSGNIIPPEAQGSQAPAQGLPGMNPPGAAPLQLPGVPQAPRR